MNERIYESTPELEMKMLKRLKIINQLNFCIAHSLLDDDDYISLKDICKKYLEEPEKSNSVKYDVNRFWN